MTVVLKDQLERVHEAFDSIKIDATPSQIAECVSALRFERGYLVSAFDPRAVDRANLTVEEYEAAAGVVQKTREDIASLREQIDTAREPMLFGKQKHQTAMEKLRAGVETLTRSLSDCEDTVSRLEAGAISAKELLTASCREDETLEADYARDEAEFQRVVRKRLIEAASLCVGVPPAEALENPRTAGTSYCKSALALVLNFQLLDEVGWDKLFLFAHWLVLTPTIWVEGSDKVTIGSREYELKDLVLEFLFDYFTRDRSRTEDLEWNYSCALAMVYVMVTRENSFGLLGMIETLRQIDENLVASTIYGGVRGDAVFCKAFIAHYEAVQKGKDLAKAHNSDKSLSRFEKLEESVATGVRGRTVLKIVYEYLRRLGCNAASATFRGEFPMDNPG